jgi:hypothetical protein
MVYTYTFSKVIDNTGIDVKTVSKLIRKAANEVNMGAYEFRNAMFSWMSDGEEQLHDGVVISFWTQYKESEERLDSFAMKLNEAFEGAKTCYMAGYIDGEIVNVYRPDKDKNCRIDRIKTKEGQP